MTMKGNTLLFRKDVKWVLIILCLRDDGFVVPDKAEDSSQ